MRRTSLNSVERFRGWWRNRWFKINVVTLGSSLVATTAFVYISATCPFDGELSFEVVVSPVLMSLLMAISSNVMYAIGSAATQLLCSKKLEPHSAVLYRYLIAYAALCPGLIVLLAWFGHALC